MSLLHLLDQNPRNFLEIVKAIRSSEDFKILYKGQSLFQILLDETFSGQNSQDETFNQQSFQKVREAWLRRLLLKYPTALNPDLLLVNFLNRQAFNAEKIMFLVRAGASPNRTYPNGTPLLYYFIRHGYYNEARQLVKTHGANPDQMANGNTGLYYLLSESTLDLKAITTLIELGADVNTQNAEGNTLLHLLVKETVGRQGLPHEYWIPKLVKEYGARLDICNKQGDTALSSLLKVPGTTLTDIMRLVHLGADPNIIDNKGTPLLHYCTQQPVEYVQQLIRFGANIRTPNSDGETAVTVFKRANRKDLITATQSLRPGTPMKTQELHAIYWRDILSPQVNFIEIARLISSGTNPDKITRQGTPLLHCFINPSFNYQAVRALKQCGADINIQDASGKTAMQLLLQKTPIDFNEVMQLIDLGADPNSKNRQGDSILHLLTHKLMETHDPRYKSMIEKLVIEYKASLGIRNHIKRTPFEMVLTDHQGNALIGDIMLFVRLGADPNLGRRDGNPLLHLFALQHDSLHYIQELVVNHNADINIQNSKKQTILDIALSKRPRCLKSIWGYHALGANLKGRTFEDVIGKLTEAELARMDELNFSCGPLLYQLLAGKEARAFTQYDLIKNRKEAIIAHINTLPKKQKVNALLDALNPDTALGKLMWTKQGGLSNGLFAILRHGWNETRLEAGALQNCLTKLREDLPTIDFHTDPALLLKVLTYSKLPQSDKNSIINKLPEKAVMPLIAYIVDNNLTKALQNDNIQSLLRRNNIAIGEVLPAKTTTPSKKVALPDVMEEHEEKSIRATAPRKEEIVNSKLGSNTKTSISSPHKDYNALAALMNGRKPVLPKAAKAPAPSAAKPPVQAAIAKPVEAAEKPVKVEVTKSVTSAPSQAPQSPLAVNHIPANMSAQQAINTRLFPSASALLPPAQAGAKTPVPLKATPTKQKAPAKKKPAPVRQAVLA